MFGVGVGGVSDALEETGSGKRFRILGDKDRMDKARFGRIMATGVDFGDGNLVGGVSDNGLTGADAKDGDLKLMGYVGKGNLMVTDKRAALKNETVAEIKGWHNETSFVVGKSGVRVEVGKGFRKWHDKSDRGATMADDGSFDFVADHAAGVEWFLMF